MDFAVGPDGGGLVQDTNLSFSLGRKPWAGAVSVVEYLLACLPEGPWFHV